jgi:hypothetical protein
VHPKLQRLDNEVSNDLKEYMSDQNISFQLVPPHVHRRNAAERALQSFKNHLIAGLCTADPDFPLNLWDKLIPQAEITLNMLRPSRLNPKISAHTQLENVFDFNRTPLAPPGTRAIAYETPSQRGTWDPHGVDGWYVGPALEHYRCYTIHVNDTGGDRTPETISFFPKKCNIPQISSAELAAIAATELIQALKNPHPATHVIFGNSQLDALRKLSEIFAAKTKPKEPKFTSETLIKDMPPLRVPFQTPLRNGILIHNQPLLGRHL